MKLKTIALPLIAALALSLPVFAAEKKTGHAEGEKIKAPNGGRVITTVEPHAEFFVTADRKVQITFLDDEGRVVAPAAQVVSVIAGDRSAPTRLTFAKAGDVLVSDAALPAGNGFPTVVQIKASAEAKTVTEKFNLNASKCPECGRAEYACICGH